MALRFDLPDRIPLFPLPGAVLMPRARMPLHLFEPRYLQLLEDTLKTDHRLIGMIQHEGDGLSAIGCAGRVVAFSETGDGRMMISLGAIIACSMRWMRRDRRGSRRSRSAGCTRRGST